MRLFFPFPVDDLPAFKQQLLALSATTKYFCYLDSNNYSNYPHSTFGSLFAIEANAVISTNENCLQQVELFQQTHKDWLFGYLSYDLKNEIEPTLHSTHSDCIQHQIVHFFVPKYLLKIENNKVEIGVHHKEEIAAFTAFLKQSIPNQKTQTSLSIQHRISKKEYINTVEEIKNNIRRGDIYELNFCQEFFVQQATIHPTQVFHTLNEISKAPFTSFFKTNEKYLLCASPERFLKRQGNQLISQPIKGTRKRLKDIQADLQIKNELHNDEKERSENVMIVDLVRNDFARIATQNSVQVEELFGIYSFEQVHQMISTITCNIKPEITFSEIIQAMFPMGSMTGAPKLSAMQLIEKYEHSKRGLFSGAVGYITPKGNFDFNVVIRSILYNATQQYVSMQTGSAITIDCDAEKEYEECLLKAQALFNALK